MVWELLYVPFSGNLSDVWSCCLCPFQGSVASMGWVLLPVPFSGFRVVWQLLPVPLWVECSCHCWCCSLFPFQGRAGMGCVLLSVFAFREGCKCLLTPLLFSGRG